MLTKDASQNGVFTCVIKITCYSWSKVRFGSDERGVFLKVCLWTWPPGDVEALVFIFLQRVFFFFFLFVGLFTTLNETLYSRFFP